MISIWCSRSPTPVTFSAANSGDLVSIWSTAQPPGFLHGGARCAAAEEALGAVRPLEMDTWNETLGSRAGTASTAWPCGRVPCGRVLRGEGPRMSYRFHAADAALMLSDSVETTSKSRNLVEKLMSSSGWPFQPACTSPSPAGRSEITRSGLDSEDQNPSSGQTDRSF